MISEAVQREEDATRIYNKAIMDPKRKVQWKAALHTEMKNTNQLEFYKLVPTPKNGVGELGTKTTP